MRLFASFRLKVALAFDSVPDSFPPSLARARTWRQRNLAIGAAKEIAMIVFRIVLAFIFQEREFFLLFSEFGREIIKSSRNKFNKYKIWNESLSQAILFVTSTTTCTTKYNWVNDCVQYETETRGRRNRGG